jgi:hypothetical protein
LDKSFCNFVIKKFESNIMQHEIIKDSGMSFTQVDFGKHDNWDVENNISLCDYTLWQAPSIVDT